jgi:hypothetical protein
VVATEGHFEVMPTVAFPFKVAISWRMQAGRPEPYRISVSGRRVTSTVLRKVPIARIMRQQFGMGWPDEND